jgi:glycerol kinase
MPSTKGIISVDQSTSATKAALLDQRGQVLKEVSIPHDSSFPQAGWVEQNAEELGKNTRQTIELIAFEAARLNVHPIGLGISNQRETVVVWNRVTGSPVYPAIGWQCLRGQRITAQWKTDGLADRVKQTTGLPLDPHFSASKIAWVLETVPGARAAANRGELAFGTIDSWLVFQLTNGSVHSTDPSNASRTMLFNLKTGVWDAGLFEAFGIPMSMAPEIHMSDAILGTASIGGFEVPISAVLGDSHAALFGLRCFEEGQAKATYGTGSSVMLNLGPHLPRRFPDSLVTSVAWGIGGETFYVLEGNIHHSGDTLRWLIDDLELFVNLKDLQTRAAGTPTASGVYLVPAFSGLGAPYWDEGARGAIVGLVRGTGKNQIARAAVESLAYQVTDLIDAMRTASEKPLTLLAVDGGPTRNASLMQFQSDITGIDVRASAVSNASMYGIGCLAGLSSGLWSGIDELKTLEDTPTDYSPRMDASERNPLVAAWRNAVARTRSGIRP